MSLGCLLADCIGLTLAMHFSGKKPTKKYTFGSGEMELNRWMDENAFVNWTRHDAPWCFENELLASGLSLPLNLDGNPNKVHKSVLEQARDEARVAARQRWANNGQIL
jgi:hypothetical protein